MEQVPARTFSHDLRRARVRNLGERVIEFLLLACGLVSVLTTFGIVWVLLQESTGFFSDVSLVESSIGAGNG